MGNGTPWGKNSQLRLGHCARQAPNFKPQLHVTTTCVMRRLAGEKILSQLTCDFCFTAPVAEPALAARQKPML